MKYVGTYSDPKDIVTKDKLEAVSSRVSTNEDNIAMAESDIDGLQTIVGTLQTNVNNVQTALTSKQDKVVGGASTITKDNLTASRALVSNSSGKVAVSSVTSTELGYLDGVTSNVQTQLNKKLEKAPVTSVNSKTGAVTLGKSDVGLGNVDNVRQYSASNPPPYPVTSVNGQTGGVNLTASDVGADASGAAAAVQSNLDGHTGNTTVHITAAERTKWNGKQDKLTGTQGQVVGFDENGNAVAQNAPSGGGMTEEAADGKYLKLVGGDMSGKLTAPKIETGSGNTNYFQSRKFRGEGDAATYYHAIDFGYAKHDQVDFHEYGGIWNFFKNTSGKADGGSLCGKITTNGWEGDAKLTGSPTAPTPGTSDNSTRIATTAFVNSFNSTKLESNGDGSNVTAAFTAASSRTNIATGEKLSVLFGKIAKWLSDLGSLAFKSTVAKTDLASDVQTSLGKADSALQSVTKSDVGLGNVDNVKQYSASNPPPYPVTSVNGKTGAITVHEVPTVTASDNGKFLRVVNGAWAAVAIANANGGSF